MIQKVSATRISQLRCDSGSLVRAGKYKFKVYSFAVVSKLQKYDPCRHSKCNTTLFMYSVFEKLKQGRKARVGVAGKTQN